MSGYLVRWLSMTTAMGVYCFMSMMPSMNVSDGRSVSIYLLGHLTPHLVLFIQLWVYISTMCVLTSDAFNAGRKTTQSRFDLTWVKIHDLQIMTVHFMSLRRLPHKNYILDCLFIYELMRSECGDWLLFTTTIMLCLCWILWELFKPRAHFLVCWFLHSAKSLNVGTVTDTLLKVIQSMPPKISR